jgi:hypothetical protein
MDIQQAVNRLRERQPLPLFVSETWDRDLDFQLREAGVEGLFSGVSIRDPHMAACAVAGLYLWNDNFTMSHNLCQGIRTETGSYWHGLCHRREGHAGEGVERNLWNAKYWFRQVGEHPAFDAVCRSALSVLDTGASGFPWMTRAADALREQRKWAPELFIDWVEQADAQNLPTEAQALLEEIQWREIDLLVDWCSRKAVGE